MNKWEEYESRKKKVVRLMVQGMDLDYETEIQRIAKDLKL